MKFALVQKSLIHTGFKEKTCELHKLTRIILGCQLAWVDDAERFVSFANEDDILNEEVITTLWVNQNAFKCSLTLSDITKLSFSIKTKEEPETQKKESRNETLKIDDFYHIQNGRKVFKSKQHLREGCKKIIF